MQEPPDRFQDAVTVNGKAESQWKVKFTGLTPGCSYCYRVFSGSPTAPGPDLLGTDPSPVFATPPAPGSTSTFRFAVLGDWGFTNSSGTNPDQANLDAQIAASGAHFALGTGDTAYPGGSQTNYGDLSQTGSEHLGRVRARLLQEHRGQDPDVQLAGQPWASQPRS